MEKGKKVREQNKFEFQHKGKTYKVIKPTGKVAEIAENEENRVFSELFRKFGICTRREMEDELEKRGLWTKKEREMLNEIRQEINKSISELSTATGKKEERIYQKIKKLREKEVEISAKYDDYFGRTVEARAEHARLMVLVALCAFHQDGKPIWKNVSDLQTEEDMGLVSKATAKILTIGMGLDVDSLELLEEDRVLKKKKEGEAKEKKEKESKEVTAGTKPNSREKKIEGK